MSDFVGSLVRRAVCAAGLAFALCTPLAAQEPLARFPEHAEFLPRFDFNASAALLGNPDQRYTWDVHWKGDFDLVDYKHGRLNFLGDYQSILGSEFRAFDPYQSNYTLEIAASGRVRRTELVGVLNHISRHLGDRFKRQAVAENSLGLRLLQRFVPGGPESNTAIDVRIDFRKVIARAYMDYNWMDEFEVSLRRRLNSKVAAYLTLHGQYYTIAQAVSAREDQYGGRAELGLRFTGTAGAVEAFVGAERMIDADPIDAVPERWSMVGFRLRR